jgi:hypothetical protein
MKAGNTPIVYPFTSQIKPSYALTGDYLTPHVIMDSSIKWRLPYTSFVTQLHAIFTPFYSELLSCT